MNSRLLPTSISIFPRREARWPEPELSTERYWGIKKGKYHYWTARGPAREAFEKIKGQIKDHLNSAGIPVPSSSFIQFDVFMIGKSQATARPYIMFSCKHLESRKAAVAAIKESKLLDQCPPGVRIGDWDYPPYLKDLRKLASSPESSNTVVGSAWNNEAAIGSYNCSVYPLVDLKSGKNRVLRLTTQSGPANDQSPCMATIGTIIRIREKRFYLVPAHVFDSQGEAAAEIISSVELRSEDSECDFGDSDSDDESSSGPQEESDFMSRYSESPKSHYLDDWDFGDINAISDGDSVQDFDMRSEQLPIITMPRGGASRTIDGLEMSSLPHLAFSIAVFPRVSSGSLDYCLIEIVDEEQFSMDLPVLSRDIIGELNYKPCNVTAVTGSGNTLRGILSDHTSCVRLPNAMKYIDVLFVQFEGSLQQGDCGSVVQDVLTGKIYGHIVAGDTKSQSALIVPAADVLDDVMAKLFEPGTVSAGNSPLPPPASEAPFNESEDQFHAGIHFGPSSHPSKCVEDPSFLGASLSGPHLSNEDQDDHELSPEQTINKDLVETLIRNCLKRAPRSPMEQQITHLRSDLERNYGKENWAMAFRAGPDSIGILAECILITSRPKVMSMEVKGPGLQYTTLSANIFHCATVGEATFRETADDMELLADLTRELSQPDGTIEKMLRFSDPGQSEGRDEFLAGIIAEGEENIAKCTAIIEKIKASFTGWCTLTKALHLALRETLGHKRGEELVVENRIRQQQLEKAQKEEEGTRDVVITREKGEELQKLRENKERYDDFARQIFMHGSVPALVATAVEGAVMAPALVTTEVLAFASYASLRSDISNMEQAQARRVQDIRELEESKAHLEVTLAQLGEDSKSIGEVAHIVEKSVRRVTDLQGLIQKFMRLLYEMNRIISKTVQHSRKAYSEFKKKNAFVDSGIKAEIMKDAFDMKTRLIFASKASDIYNAVSSQFILPTLDALLVAELSETAGHDIQAKIDQLHLLRCKVSSESDHLTRKMHQELKESMEEVTRDSARVFEEHLPVGQIATA